MIGLGSDKNKVPSQFSWKTVLGAIKTGADKWNTLQRLFSSRGDRFQNKVKEAVRTLFPLNPQSSTHHHLKYWIQWIMPYLRDKLFLTIFAIKLSKYTSSDKIITATEIFVFPLLAVPPSLASGKYLSNSITSSFHIFTNRYLASLFAPYKAFSHIFTHTTSVVQLWICVDQK